MKLRIQNYLLKLIVLVVLLGADIIAFCQGGPPGGAPPGGSVPTGTGPPCWDPDCVPIDGGVGFLIAAGTVLGVKKIRDYRKQ